MDHPDAKQHWEGVYGRKAEDEVSWFQSEPVTSLAFIRRCGGGPNVPIIDVGGGESRLVDRLLDAGYRDVSVLDISAGAIEYNQRRLAARADQVRWIVADITSWQPERRYRLWHDRAVLHFLVAEPDRAAYRRTLETAMEPGGCVVISTFGPDGPEHCSGLPVRRYSAAALAAELGPQFRLVETVREEHRTPGGLVQPFQFSRLTRL